MNKIRPRYLVMIAVAAVLALAAGFAFFYFLAPKEKPVAEEQILRVMPPGSDIPLSEEKQKLDTDLLGLVDQNFLLPSQDPAQVIAQMKEQKQFVAADEPVSNINKKFEDKPHGDLVYVYVKLNPGVATSVLDPIAWLVSARDEENGLASVLVEVSRVEELAALSGVKSIELVIPPVTNATTQGDVILKTLNVRNDNTITAGKRGGAGMKVGVISDGVNDIAESNGVRKLSSTSIANNELPTDVTVLSNYFGGDEGTAMLEIIHDMVPDAKLYFHDLGGTTILFNAAIDALVAAGVDVIVDDVGWINEPFFEDGVVAKHVAAVLASHDIIYVSSAGNAAQNHYQNTFNNYGNGFHNFAGQGMSYTIPPLGSIRAVLGWDDSFGSSANNYDLYLYDDAATRNILTRSQRMQNGDDQPWEIISYTNTSTSASLVVWVDVFKPSSATFAKTIELYVYNDFTDTAGGYAYAAPSANDADSIFGHPAVPGVIAVGAISASDPGNDTIEPFSSQGPVTLIGSSRNKPDITGIDGVQISGAGGFPSPFYGTSAAAPHIAAVAAQIWGINRGFTGNQIRGIILNSASPINPSTVYGSGLADAMEARTDLGTALAAKDIAAFNLTSPSVTCNLASPAAPCTVDTGVSPKKVTITVPIGTVLTDLRPVISITGKSVSPANSAPRNFIDSVATPVIYTVTAVDNTTQNYAVTIKAALSTAKAITEFKLTSPPVTGTISGTNIALTVPNGTTSITPSISISAGASIVPGSGSPASGVSITIASYPAVFSYAVTAAAGGTPQTYAVTVSVAGTSTKEISAFSFTKALNSSLPTSPAKFNPVVGVIDQNVKTISLTVPFGINLTTLQPTIGFTGASISQPLGVTPATITASPANGAPNDFTTPKIYTVTAANGSTQAYTVSVNIEAGFTDKAITSFNITAIAPTATLPIIGVINEVAHTISVTVPRPTTAITPTIVHTGASITPGGASPASGVSKSITSYPATFTYTVTAIDTTTQIYNVTVDQVAAPADNLVPTVARIDPANKSAGGATFDLTVIGTGFVSGSVVRFNGDAAGNNRVTTYVSPTQLTAVIPYTDILAVGSPRVIKVFNPAPVGGLSTATTVVLTVTPNPDIAYVADDVAALTDNLIIGGNSAITNITEHLTDPLPSIGAVNGSAITWASNATAVVSSDGQTVTRPAYNAAQNATVTMTATLTKGTVTSTKAFTLTVMKLPAPSTVTTVTSSLYIVTIVTNDGVTSGTISRVPFGTSKADFLAALTKGEPNQTWDSTDIQAPVLYDDTLEVTAQAGGTPVIYTVVVSTGNPVPAIISIDPNSKPMGAATFEMTVTGSGFVPAVGAKPAVGLVPATAPVPSSVVRLNGVDKVTRYISSTQLIATIPAADIAAVGSPREIKVFSPPASVGETDGGLSAAITFTVNASITATSGSILQIPGGKLNDVSTGTIEFWFKTTQTTGDQILFSAARNSNNNLTITLTGDEPDMTLTIEGKGSRGTFTTALEDGVIQKDKWYHLAYVADLTETRVYLNGTRMTVTSTLNSSPTPANTRGFFFSDIIDGVDSIILGRDSVSGGSVFVGQIDNLAIFNKALNAESISAHYGISPAAVGLVSLFHFEETGDSTVDSSINNLPVSFSSYPGRVEDNGLFGWGLDFAANDDGTGDALMINSAPELSFNKGVTVSAWVKLDDGDPAPNQHYDLAAMPLRKIVANDLNGGLDGGFSLTIGPNPTTGGAGTNGCAGNTICFGVRTEGNQFRYAGASIVDATIGWRADDWNYLVGTYDNKQVKLYLNGRQLSAFPTTIPTTESPYASKYPDLPVCIGSGLDRSVTGSYTCDTSVATGKFFIGRMDEVAIYNKALTSADISNLMGVVFDAENQVPIRVTTARGSVTAHDPFRFSDKIWPFLCTLDPRFGPLGMPIKLGGENFGDTFIISAATILRKLAVALNPFLSLLNLK